jgi:DNA segregation ATPase FtsK/SpoIIIE-like protein
MDNGKRNAEPATLKDWITVTCGILLICLTLIGATNETIIGTFLTYSLAYLFGLFYPIVLLLMAIFGIRLVYSHKGFPVKEHGLFWLGILLVAVGVLAFGSYPLILSDSGLSFVTFSSVYQDRMMSFASHPFIVDSFRSLGQLGGGYLGAFFIGLFGSIFQAIGDGIFFSIVLIAGFFLILIQPLRHAIARSRIQKASETYYSPYRVDPKKGSGAPVSTAVRPDNADLRTSFDSTWRNNTQAIPASAADATPLPSSPRPTPSGLTPVTTILPAQSVSAVSRSSPSEVSSAPAVSSSPVPPAAPMTAEEKSPVLSMTPEEALKRQSESAASQSTDSGSQDVVLPTDKPEETEQTPAGSPAPQESDEDRVTRLYFEKKRRQEEIRKAAAEKEKADRFSSVLRFVSDKERTYTYVLPDDSLLEMKSDDEKVKINIDTARAKAPIINKVLRDFTIDASVKSVTVSSAVTRFNIQMSPGVSGERIVSHLTDFQSALNGDKSVRIETVVEGLTTSGIEIGNPAPVAFSFHNAFVNIEKDATEPLLLPIGMDISGHMVSFPLGQMPHLLVAGTTGSGKSVLIHSMIMTLIMRNYPNALKLMLIDPKQVEFSRYQMEPHLYCPVIFSAPAAITALGKLCEEMDRRYTVLSASGCVQVSEYRIKRKGHEDTMEELPAIVCVIDEFADLMQTGGDAVASYVQRLAQKARAASIFLIIATQRPSKDVIPMVIKGNIACRIGLCCATNVDSRVILDEPGAETLLGHGDLLFKCPGRKSLIRAQSPFITDKDMDQVLTYLKTKAGAPNYSKDFVDLEPAATPEIVSDADSAEQLYQQIEDYVEDTGIVSKPLFMRNFYISSSKADSIIFRLRNEGIVEISANGTYSVLKRSTDLER